MAPNSPFADNLARLAGLHRLNGLELAKRLGLSRQAVSALLAGHSQPSTQTLLKVEELFGVGSEIMTSDFGDLLPTAERFYEVEDRLSRQRLAALRIVVDDDL